MISFGNAALSHGGLIPLKTAYKNRGELLKAIAGKKSFINCVDSMLFHRFYDLKKNFISKTSFQNISKTLP